MILKKIKRILAFSLLLAMLLTILPPVALAAGSQSYEKATSIAVGDTVLLVYEAAKKELSSISTTSTKYGIGQDYDDKPTGVFPLTVVEGSATNTYAFKTEDGKYLYWSSGNSLNVNATLNANTSWTVTFDADGNAVIKNAKDSTRIIQWNAQSPRFACYTGGQQSVQLYKLTSGTSESECDHNWDDGVTTATCTEAGITTYTCTLCGETKEENAEALGHTYVDGVCKTCGEAEPTSNGSYQKATSIAVGDTVIIVCETKSMEMNGFSNNNYADGVAYGEIPAGAYPLTVVAGATEGTFAFETYDGKYLSGPSKVDNNHLVLSESIDHLSSWTVTIANGGDADICVDYSGTARYIRWNSASNALRFATYKSGQTAVQIYKFVVNTEQPTEPTEPSEEPTEPTECVHESKTSTGHKDPTCTEDGYDEWTCNTCGESGRENLYASSEYHIPGEPSEAILLYPTCYYEGKKEIIIRCTTCNGVISHIADTPIPMLPHNYADGCCTVCQKDAPGKQFYLTDLANLPNAKKVVIYHPASGMAISLNASGEKLAGSAVTVENGVLTTAEDTAVFTFAYIGWETPKVFQVLDYDDRFLVSGETGNKLFYGEYEDYSSTDNVELTYWIPTLVDEANSTFQIMNKAAAYNGNTNQALEFYNNENLFTVYGVQDNDQFYFQFYTNIQPEHTHDWGEGEVTTEPTCQTAGVRTYSCSGCGETKTEAIDTLDHNYSDVVVTSPSCTERGFTTYTCTNAACGDSYTENYTSPLGHTWVDATCTSGPYCSVCNASGSTYEQIFDVSKLKSNDRIIIIANVDGIYKALNAELTSTIAATDVEIQEGLLVGEEIPLWTLEEVSGGFALSVDGTYLKHSGKADFVSSQEPFAWTFENTDNGIRIFSGTRAIVYRTNANGFKAYAASNIGSSGYYGDLLVFKYTDGSTLPHADEDDNNLCDDCGAYIEAAALLSRSISLNGNIAVNFYMSISPEDATDPSAYMLFTQEDREPVMVPVSEAVIKEQQGQGAYVFTYEVAAKEMTDTITAQFIVGNFSTEEYTYSVRAYAERTTASLADNTTLVNLLHAMLHYGAASQIQFNYHTERLADDGLESVDYSAVKVEGFPTVLPQGTDLVTFAGASLLLESETTLRFFLRADASVESFTVTYNGQPLELKTRNGLYYADVKNIAAPDLDMPFSITVDDGTNTADITYSPLTYCSSIRKNHNTEQNQALLDVCAALYLYNQAANTYFTPAE